jgi:hypothetical protein
MNALIECCFSMPTETNAGLTIPSQLCRNLETMSAACALWTHIVTSDNGNNRISARIASSAVPDYASNEHGAFDDAHLREFLKTKSNSIPQFIMNTATMVSTSGHPLAAEFGQASFQVEANALVLVSMLFVDVLSLIQKVITFIPWHHRRYLELHNPCELSSQKGTQEKILRSVTHGQVSSIRSLHPSDYLRYLTIRKYSKLHIKWCKH